MPRIMNKKDIEDFLRRSNSITDQGPIFPPEDTEVPVRRMSLKEFTGLDPSNKEQIADLSLASWKKSASGSLINSYSARRRSVLSNDPMDSPTRRLSAPREESVDLGTALEKVYVLRQRLSESSQPEATASNADDGGYGERKMLLEDARAMVGAIKEFGEISSLKDAKMNSTTAELADVAESLLSSALVVISTGSVYQSQLVSTELNQVLSSLESLLTEIRLQTEVGDKSLPAKHISHLTSAANQLVLAVTALN